MQNQEETPKGDMLLCLILSPRRGISSVMPQLLIEVLESWSAWLESDEAEDEQSVESHKPAVLLL
jgi:hypothetical protein